MMWGSFLASFLLFWISRQVEGENTCPDLWYSLHGSSCYGIYQYRDRYSYQQALAICESYDAQVYVPNSDSEYDAVSAFLASQSNQLTGRYVWIGCDEIAHDGVFQCVDETQLDIESDWWGNSFPSAGGIYRCVEIDVVYSPYRIYDDSCGSWNIVFCEAKPLLSTSSPTQGQVTTSSSATPISLTSSVAPMLPTTTALFTDDTTINAAFAITMTTKTTTDTTTSGATNTNTVNVNAITTTTTTTTDTITSGATNTDIVNSVNATTIPTTTTATIANDSTTSNTTNTDSVNAITTTTTTITSGATNTNTVNANAITTTTTTTTNTTTSGATNTNTVNVNAITTTTTTTTDTTTSGATNTDTVNSVNATTIPTTTTATIATDSTTSNTTNTDIVNAITTTTTTTTDNITSGATNTNSVNANAITTTTTTTDTTTSGANTVNANAITTTTTNITTVAGATNTNKASTTNIYTNRGTSPCGIGPGCSLNFKMFTHDCSEIYAQNGVYFPAIRVYFEDPDNIELGNVCDEIRSIQKTGALCYKQNRRFHKIGVLWGSRLLSIN